MNREIYFIILIFTFIITSPLTKLICDESPSIGDLQVFPEDNVWNWDISSYEVHPNSDNFIFSIGGNETLHPDFGTYWNGAPIGIPYCVVHNDQPLIPIIYTAYGDESDPGPFPIPLDAPIEGGPDSDGDRHVLAVDLDNAMLYELYRSFPVDSTWEAASGAKFDLTSNDLRPEYWTSADAAGLPIFPGLVRYEEVYINKEITHALRFTVERTQRKFIWPARHYASPHTDPNLPPMGLRFRLKADFDTTSFSEPVRVILRALKKYGMMVADNGSNWFITGAPDDRWDDDILGELKTITGSNFEAVRTVDDDGNPIYPPQTNIPPNVPKRIDFVLKNYPNPFNSSTTIEYSLPLSCQVNIKIYSLSGQIITTLFKGYQSEGEYKSQWLPTGLASGIYLYKIQAGKYIKSGKILYQK